MLFAGTFRMRMLMVIFTLIYVGVCYFAFVSLPDLNSTASGRFNPRGPHLVDSDEVNAPEMKERLVELRKRLNYSLEELKVIRQDIKEQGIDNGKAQEVLKAVDDKLNQANVINQARKQANDLDEETKKRRDFIRKMMEHAWGGYVKHAWGQSEVRPDSLQGHNAGIFGGSPFGATIVDSLDTLFVMGMKDEFDRARKWVADNLDFSKLNAEVSVFEFTIRYVGGLLSAYALSKDDIFLKRAKELADRLLPAFDTPTGIPYSLLNLQTRSGKNYHWASSGCSILAEIGTLQLEFVYLSQLTGDPTYAQKTRKVRQLLITQPKTDGLYPNYVNPHSGSWCAQETSVGALGDSFYEYLLKDWLRTGRSDAELRNAFDAAVEAIRTHLAQRSASGFLFFAERRNGALQHRTDHLSCFFGGTLALGSQHVPDANKRRDWFNAAAEFTRTCHESYIRTATHLGPDTFHFAGNNEFFTQRSGERGYLLRPEVIESYFYMWRFTHNTTYRDWAWDAAQAIERYCRGQAGYAGIQDVYSVAPARDDVQQSYFLAETLKYLYLTFSPDSVMSLDEWVFNTEAHPLPVVHE